MEVDKYVEVNIAQNQKWKFVIISIYLLPKLKLFWQQTYKSDILKQVKACPSLRWQRAGGNWTPTPQSFLQSLKTETETRTFLHKNIIWYCWEIGLAFNALIIKTDNRQLKSMMRRSIFYVLISNHSTKLSLNRAADLRFWLSDLSDKKYHMTAVRLYLTSESNIHFSSFDLVQSQNNK